MGTDLFYGLLAEQLLLGLLLALMLLEMLKASPRVADALVKLVLLAACAVLVRQYAQGYDVDLLPGEVRVDRFAVLAKLVLLSCALLLSLVSPVAATFKSGFLVCSSLLGALIVMDSAGFIPLFIGIEMLSLPAFALIVSGTGTTSASEGAFKYLVLSSIATALLLFGIAFAYGITGTLSIAAFAEAVGAGSSPAVAAGILVASGFFLKAAVFPFHGWAPDAYAGARLQVTAFLASIVKGAVILALVRIFAAVGLNAATVAIIAVLSLLSIYYGNVAAIKQRNFKRLLAYSSIAHAGYMLIAFIDTSGGRVADLLWYVAIYASTVIVACASFSILCPGERDDVQSTDGAFHSHPVAALVFGLAMLSLAGLPPLPGFFAKLFIFSSVIASQYLVAAIIAFIGSFIGVTYYLALFFRLFATDPRSASVNSNQSRTLMK
jgi:NADH-quinone oxidoreductase subunit N